MMTRTHSYDRANIDEWPTSPTTQSIREPAPDQSHHNEDTKRYIWHFQELVYNTAQLLDKKLTHDC